MDKPDYVPSKGWFFHILDHSCEIWNDGKIVDGVYSAEVKIEAVRMTSNAIITLRNVSAMVHPKNVNVKIEGE